MEFLSKMRLLRLNTPDNAMKTLYVDEGRTVEQLMEEDTILQNCQRQLGHQLPLSSYLLKPVQRLTKYQLLLKVSLASRGNMIKLLSSCRIWSRVRPTGAPSSPWSRAWSRCCR